ncbi:MAG: DMT family transporter [Bdellovibrionales bacterium]|nr:DMT family transporter [Bdellovibrionales bacterium]
MTSFSAGILFATLTGFCWALLAIGLKYALQFASTGTIVWIRMMVAFTLLFLIYFFRERQTLKKIFFKPPWQILLAGLFLAFNYFGYMKGLELTTASNAQIMIQMGPLSLLFVGVIYFRETIRPIQWIGIGIASIGFILFYLDQMLIVFQNTDLYLTGNIWIFFAAITWTGFASLQKYQLVRGWTPQMVNLLIYGICCLALFPSANLGELTPLSPWQWSVLFILGVNTLIAYGALGEALQRIPASYVSLIIAVNPLLTIFAVGLIAHLGLTFINPEPIMWRGYLGAIMVVSGVAIAVSLKAKVKKT